MVTDLSPPQLGQTQYVSSWIPWHHPEQRVCRLPCMSLSWGRKVSEFLDGWGAMQCVSHRHRNPEVPRATELAGGGAEIQTQILDSLFSGFWVGLYQSRLDFGE